jgi:hypothetical protein
VTRHLPHPRAALLLIIGLSIAARAATAMARPTPLYYPDEYLYSTLARSIATSGIPQVRGGSAHFPALLGPYLMAPAWLIHNTDIAYRVALAWSSAWFSAAAVPAYLLARRVGLTQAMGLFVALVTLLVPDAAFTTTLLSEPFAFPVFLTAVLLAVDTIAAPTRKRQSLLLGLMLALCLLRLQFVVFPAAYLAAAFAHSNFSAATLVRKQPVVITGLGAGSILVAAVGVSRVAGVYGGIGTLHFSATGVVRWYLLDLFVLCIAAGWVVVPGAAVGIVSFLRHGSPPQRAFAFLTVALIVFLVAEAACFGANEGRVHERYVFYLTPMIVVPFAWAAQSLVRSGLYVAIAYLAAAAAIALPLLSGLRSATDDESPSVLGLGTLTGGGTGSTLIWAMALTALAVATGLRLGGPRVTSVVALALLGAVGAAGTLSLLGFGSALGWRLNLSTDVPRLHAPRGSALITVPGTNRFLLMKTLFWNPGISRVLVLGNGHAADGYAATDVQLRPPGVLVDRNGRSVPGPFAIDTDTMAASRLLPDSRSATRSVFLTAPTVMVFGWNRDDRYLETVSRLVAVAGGKPVKVTLSLASPNGSKTMAISCGAGVKKLPVSRKQVLVGVGLARMSRRTCRMSLVRGEPVSYRERTVSVQGISLAIRRTPAAAIDRRWRPSVEPRQDAFLILSPS